MLKRCTGHTVSGKRCKIRVDRFKRCHHHRRRNMKGSGPDDLAKFNALYRKKMKDNDNDLGARFRLEASKYAQTRFKNKIKNGKFDANKIAKIMSDLERF